MAVKNVRQAVSRQEAAEMYGVPLDVIVKAIHATPPTLKAKKVGRRYAINVDDLAAWFAALPDA